jgi:hypothetical protein
VVVGEVAAVHVQDGQLDALGEGVAAGADEGQLGAVDAVVLEPAVPLDLLRRAQV